MSANVLINSLQLLLRNTTKLARKFPTNRTTTRTFNSNIRNFTNNMSPSSSNKVLRLNDYDIIGFDLDGTLLRYDLNNMTKLIYDVLKKFLVDQRGHSTALLDLPLDWDFLQKGLVLDGPRGNVLKLSHNAVILRATHGTQQLTDDEIIAIYGPKRQWDLATAFYHDPLSTWNGPAATQMRMLLDYFDMPSALVFAQAVDIVDKESAGHRPENYHVWADLLAALMHNYSRDNFSNGQSLYFNSMRSKPEHYVLPASSRLIDWLQELRSAGKKIFLLTGSNIDFANLTATQAFGTNWRQMFDFVATYAKKPGFFIQQRPFLNVNVSELHELANSELSLETTLQSSEVYSQGNWHQLQAAMVKLLNTDGSKTKTLYFGDNIIQDVYTPVKHRDFDAVAIAEELLVDKNDYPFAKALHSNRWGSYFGVDSTPSLWTGLISNYAQFCISTMDIVAEYPPSQRIESTNAMGFYPNLPNALKK